MKETDVGRTCEGPLGAPKNEWALNVMEPSTYRRGDWKVQRIESGRIPHKAVWQVHYGVTYSATFETFDRAVEHVDRLLNAPDVTMDLTGAYIPANEMTSQESAAIRSRQHRAFNRTNPSEGASFGLQNLCMWVASYGNVPAGTRVFYVRINGEERLTLVLPKGTK